MKKITYLFTIMSLMLSVSCEKHQILYDVELIGDKAEFQLHYFQPITNVAANYIDSVFVNGTLYSSVLGSGQLLPYNGVPGGATGRFFAVPHGNVNFKFYRGPAVIYDQTATLTSGKQNVFVYDLSKPPIVIDNGFPYNDITTASGTASNWNTDSICTVAFYNFLYENASTPYSGKIQYQYQDFRTKEWKNLGSPVAFGQATIRQKIVVVKEVFNSQGSRRVDYRMLDENGEVLRLMNSSGAMVNYSDYWTATIGRAYMHLFGGIRTATPVASVRQWTSL